MKIIFLDIDGVLNSAEFANRHYEETGKPLFMYDFLDPDAVNRLKEFLDQHTDIRIVLSSSWRTFCKVKHGKLVTKNQNFHDLLEILENNASQLHQPQPPPAA